MQTAALPALLLFFSTILHAKLDKELERAENLRNAGDYMESLEIAERALDEAEAKEKPRLMGKAYLQKILAHYFLDEPEKARSLLDVALTHCRLHDLSSLEGELLSAEGVLEWKKGNLWLARRLLGKAYAMKENLGEEESMVSIANNLGIISYSLKEYSAAVRQYQKGLSLLGKGGNPRLRASLLSNMGESLLRMERFKEAESRLQQSLSLEKELKEPHYLAYTYFNLGELRAAEGNWNRAEEFYRKALNSQEKQGNTWGAALTRLHLAKTCHAKGETGRAFDVLEPGYREAKALNALSLLRDYADVYAELYGAEGEEGLRNYYTDLREWISNRLRGGEKTVQNEVRSMAAMSTAEGPSVPRTTPWRYSVVALLLLLILTLLLEIRRLRRLRRLRRRKTSAGS